MYLSDVPLNSKVKIVSVSCPNTVLNQRLLDLGFHINSVVTPVFASPFNNPIAYEVKNTIIALRKDDSKFILTKPINS